MQKADVSASDGVFENVTPCQALLDILTTTSNGTMGNFTKKPTSELLQQCSSQHSAFMLDGDALVHAFKQPTPMVKVCVIATSSFISVFIELLETSSAVLRAISPELAFLAFNHSSPIPAP